LGASGEVLHRVLSLNWHAGQQHRVEQLFFESSSAQKFVRSAFHCVVAAIWQIATLWCVTAVGVLGLPTRALMACTPGGFEL
jgi:hypothetical protein